MTDEEKTREQLITELVELRKIIAELEASRVQRNQMEEALRESHNRFFTGDSYIRTALVCSAITLILGTLVMIGWVTGLYNLASFGLGSIPMAPGTSLAFILLGGTWFFYLRAPSSRLTRVSVLASVFFVCF